MPKMSGVVYCKWELMREFGFSVKYYCLLTHLSGNEFEEYTKRKDTFSSHMGGDAWMIFMV